MSKPPFTMSKYASMNDLLTDKAKYYQEQNKKLVEALRAISDADNLSPDALSIMAYDALQELESE